MEIEKLITATEAAELLGVKKGTILIWARDPERAIQVYRPGRRPMFRASELLDWARRREEERRARRHPGRPQTVRNPFNRM